jgi:hypothetical protein
MTREDEIKLSHVSEAFNKMDYEHRKIASNSGLADQIRELQRISIRIDEAYRKEMKSINERIEMLLNAIDIE